MYSARLTFSIILAVFVSAFTAPDGRAGDCSCDKVSITSLKLVSVETCGLPGASCAYSLVAGRIFTAGDPATGEDLPPSGNPDDGVRYTSPDGFKLEVENGKPFPVQMGLESVMQFGKHKFRMSFGCGVEKVVADGNELSVRDKESDTVGGYTLMRKGCGVVLESPGLDSPGELITITAFKPVNSACPAHEGAAPPAGEAAGTAAETLNASYTLGTGTGNVSPGLLGWSAATAAGAISIDSLGVPGMITSETLVNNFVLEGTQLMPKKVNAAGVARLQFRSQTVLLDATGDSTSLTLSFYTVSGTADPTVDWDNDNKVDFHDTSGLTSFKRVKYVLDDGEITVKTGTTGTLADTIKLHFADTSTSHESIWTDLPGQKTILVKRQVNANGTHTVTRKEYQGAALLSWTSRVYAVHPVNAQRYRLLSTTRHSGDTAVPDITEELAYDSADPDFVKSRVGSDGTWTHYRKAIPSSLDQQDMLDPPTGQNLSGTLVTIRPWLGAAAPGDDTIAPAQSVIDIRRAYGSDPDAPTTTISETFTAGVLSGRNMTVRVAESGFNKTITHTWSDAAHSTSTQSWTYPSGTYEGRLYRTVDPDDKCTTYTYADGGNDTVITTATGGSLASPYGIAEKSTRTITTEDADGRVLSVLTQMFTGNDDWETATSTTIDYQKEADGRVLATTTSRDGRVVSVVENNGLTTVSSGEDGRMITDTRDEDGNPVSSVENGHGTQPSITTSHSRDGLSTLTTRSASGTPSMVTSATRNLLGDLVSSTDAVGTDTTIAVTRAQDLSTITETSTTNGVTRWTTRYRDGRFKESGGTGAIATRATYEVAANGFLVTTNSTGPATSGHSPRWTSVTTDWAGRVVERVAPAPPAGIDGSSRHADVATVYEYDACGRQFKVSDNTGRATVLTTYDDGDTETEDYPGSVVSSGSDVDDDGALAPGVDRLTITEHSYVKEDGFWWEKTTTTVPDGGNDPLVVTRKEKLYQATGSETVTTDAAGNVTTTTVAVNRETRTVTTTTTNPDGTVTSVQVNGLLVSSTSPGATRVAEYAYDGLRRLIRQTDIRGAVTWLSYDAAGRMVGTTNHEGKGTRYEYYPAEHANAGLLWKITHPDGSTAERTYDAMGRMIAATGTAHYPQAYSYDDFGGLHTLVTSGSQTATTTWQTDPATGLVLAKQTQDGKQVKYAYDAAGAVVQRKWARGITTTVARNTVTGDITGISHDDNATFSVAYAGHDIFGRPGTVTETRGGVASTTALAYNPLSGVITTMYAPDDPFLPGITLNANPDDTYGRATGHSVIKGGNTIHSWTLGYDDHGRLGMVTGHGMTATLAYYPGTGMLQSQTTTANNTQVLRRDHNVDLLGRTYGVVNRGGDTNDLIASVAHTYDAANRRVTARREDGAKWTYGYNTRSEVTAAAKRLEDATAIPGLEFGYSYDGLGNRLAASKGNPAITTAYTPDAMNRYSAIASPGADDILVRSGIPVGIAADGQAGTVTTAGTLHNGRVAVDNDPDGAWADITVTATGFSDTGHRWVPPATVAPTYDDDGNLLTDGRWTYTWDAMNRLVAMAPSANALTAGVPNQIIEFAYDFASRRIGKKVTTTSGTGSTVKDTRYLYDGWNVVAEFDANGSTLTKTATYAWSQDLSGTLQGAGGVGGLLSVNLVGAGTFLPCYDANGNIIAWTDGNGSPAQRQDYDPFGNLVIVERLAITPAASARLTYGFSTKPLDAETGLHYYGYRYYDARNGRWINRDPIGENGGLNLYGFVGNDGVNWLDVLGLVETPAGGIIGGTATPYLPPHIPIIPATKLELPELSDRQKMLLKKLLERRDRCNATCKPNISQALKDVWEGARGAVAGTVQTLNPSNWDEIYDGVAELSFLVNDGQNANALRLAYPDLGRLVLDGDGMPDSEWCALLYKIEGNAGGGVVAGGLFKQLAQFRKLRLGKAAKTGAGLETRGLRPAPGTRVRPEGIPEGWRIRPTDSGGGVQYYNPANPNQNVRVMQGNPNSPYPNSQAPYVRQQNAGGTYLRQDGTPSPLPRGGLRDGDAHIPLDQFIFRP